MPETSVREYKYKPEDFLKKEKRNFWRGERGNSVAQARSVLAPPSRARTSPFAGGSETSEAPFKVFGLFPNNIRQDFLFSVEPYRLVLLLNKANK